MSLNPTSSNANGSNSNLNNLFDLESAVAPYSTALTAAPTDWTLAINYTGTGISYNSLRRGGCQRRHLALQRQ